MRLLFLLIAIQLHLNGFSQRKPPTVNEPLVYRGPFVVNGNTTDLKTLDDFKGEYLILDLFSSSCIVCFQMMPKVNQLQQEFKGKVRFLLIGRQDGKIAPLYKKFEKGLNLKLDVVFDSVFFRKIRIKQVPTYIWIRPDGTVAAVTSPSSLSKASIDSFLQGKHVDPGKLVEKYPFDHTAIFHSNGNGGPDSNFLRRTIFGKATPEMLTYLPEKLEYLEPNKTCNISNVSKSVLYKFAYWGTSLWDFKDTIRYIRVHLNPIFLDENGNEVPELKNEPDYFYSDSYQGESVPDIKERLQWELKNYFAEKVEFVKRQMPCWVLRLAPGGRDKIKTKYAKTSYSHSLAGVDFRNVQIWQLMSILYFNQRSDTVFVNETEIDFPVDIKLDALLTVREDVFEAVRNLGITIDLESREMEVMLVKPLKNRNQ